MHEKTFSNVFDDRGMSVNGEKQQLGCIFDFLD